MRADWIAVASRPAVGFLLAGLLFGCPGSNESATTPWANDAPSADDFPDDGNDPDGGDEGQDKDEFGPCEPVDSPQTISENHRAAEVQGPSDWCANHPLPVVFLLHGYGASAWLQDLLFRLNTRVEEMRFLLVLPDGTVDAVGRRHWNATPACCDFYGADIDDVSYLTGLLDELEERFTIDPDRVYFTGHSNGGFMSYRMACEIPHRIAAIAPLAGSTFENDASCLANEPVSVLHIHPTLDTTIPYAGTLYYPSADEATRRWAERNGCDPGAAQDGTPLDLVDGIGGNETRVVDYRTGCDEGFHASLWAIEGAGHVPVVSDSFSSQLLDWLMDHSR